MKSRLLVPALLLGCAGIASAAADDKAPRATSVAQPPQPQSAAPALSVVQYRLGNGLTVLLSQDRRVPIVATEVVYLVGSSYEKPGKTGFAHLFEHLMFQGSKHHDEEYFAPFEPIGAEVNGTTSQDRTNYYEHVPQQYTELSLWMESDRMRSLLDVLTQEKLDNQREVVKNERRQRYEVTPYGMDYWYLSEALYPVGHPYRHTPIGSHEDLTRASLADVQAFFKQYYVASNAALVVAGDFEIEPMKALIEKYFGDIRAGERAPNPKAETPKITSPVHWIAEDDVELPRVYLAWHTPALLEAGDADLDLLSAVLSDGKSSRLFQSLVYQDKVAKDVSAYQMSHKLSGVYMITATAAPGVSVEKLGQALEEALKKALSTPPTEVELTRARSQFKKDFFHRLEGIGEKASLIGSYFLHTGQGDAIARDYGRYVDATAATVKAAGDQYLDLGRVVRLDFIPGKKDAPVRVVPPAAAPASAAPAAAQPAAPAKPAAAAPSSSPSSSVKGQP